jgi:hypothetical protein
MPIALPIDEALLLEWNMGRYKAVVKLILGELGSSSKGTRSRANGQPPYGPSGVSASGSDYAAHVS